MTRAPRPPSRDKHSIVIGGFLPHGRDELAQTCAKYANASGDDIDVGP